MPRPTELPPPFSALQRVSETPSIFPASPLPPPHDRSSHSRSNSQRIPPPERVNSIRACQSTPTPLLDNEQPRRLVSRRGRILQPISSFCHDLNEQLRPSTRDDPNLYATAYTPAPILAIIGLTSSFLVLIALIIFCYLSQFAATIVGLAYTVAVFVISATVVVRYLMLRAKGRDAVRRANIVPEMGMVDDRERGGEVVHAVSRRIGEHDAELPPYQQGRNDVISPGPAPRYSTVVGSPR